MNVSSSGVSWKGQAMNQCVGVGVSGRDAVDKDGRYLVGKGFGVGGYGHASGLNAELLDAETDVDDLSLTSLGHDHTAQRIVIGEVVSNHRLKELFWRHVVGGLLWMSRQGGRMVSDAGDAEEEGWTDRPALSSASRLESHNPSTFVLISVCVAS